MIAERDWTCIANCPFPLVCSTEVGFDELKSGFSTYCVVHHSLPIPSFASCDSGTLRGVKLLAVECGIARDDGQIARGPSGYAFL